jgi:voltage-dependent calcium channel T type alpha-1G
MHSCGHFEEYENKTIKCNLTIDEKMFDPKYTNNDSTCINWNLYYTECQERGPNPFQGTISFDNIGLAWVSIFLVNIPDVFTRQ